VRTIPRCKMHSMRSNSAKVGRRVGQPNDAHMIHLAKQKSFPVQGTVLLKCLEMAHLDSAVKWGERALVDCCGLCKSCRNVKIGTFAAIFLVALRPSPWPQACSLPSEVCRKAWGHFWGRWKAL